MTFRLRSGQILVELLLALGVMVLSVVTLAQLTTRSVSNAGFSRMQSVASAEATAGMEWVRQQRDQLGWDVFAQIAGTHCINSLAWAAGECPAGSSITGTILAREVVMSGTGNPNQRQADVVVKWQEGNRPAAVKQTTVFNRY